MSLSPDRVRAIFNNLSSPDTSSQFWEHVSPNVHWTVSGTTPISGVYTARTAFQSATINYLGSDVLTEPLRIRPVHIHVAPAATEVGDSSKGSGSGRSVATVELQAIDAVCQNGLKYDMRYCWICTFDDASEMIEEVRAYLDTDLLQRAIEQNK